MDISAKQYIAAGRTKLISTYEDLLTSIDELADTNRKFLYFGGGYDLKTDDVEYDVFTDAYEYIDVYRTHPCFRNAFDYNPYVKRSVEDNLQANYLINHLKGDEPDNRLVDIYKVYFTFRSGYTYKFFRAIIKVAYPEYYKEVYRYRWRYNRGIYSPFVSNTDTEVHNKYWKDRRQKDLDSIPNASIKQIYESYNEYKKHMEE